LHCTSYRATATPAQAGDPIAALDAHNDAHAGEEQVGEAGANAHAGDQVPQVDDAAEAVHGPQHQQDEVGAKVQQVPSASKLVAVAQSVP
jgi:hypothetical protein